MLDIQTRFHQLNRPKLLIKAARFGLDDYRRGAHLRRLLNTEHPPRPVFALILLLDLEQAINAERAKAGDIFSRPPC
ncbi:MAG: DUF6477 family protein [Yoonia sp.]